MWSASDHMVYCCVFLPRAALVTCSVLGCQSKYSNTQNLSAADLIRRTGRYTGMPRHFRPFGVFLCGVRTGNAVVIVDVNKLVRLSKILHLSQGCVRTSWSD